MLAFPVCNTNLRETEMPQIVPSLASMTIRFPGESTSASALIIPGVHPHSQTCLPIWGAHAFPFSPIKTIVRPRRESTPKANQLSLTALNHLMQSQSATLTSLLLLMKMTIPLASPQRSLFPHLILKIFTPNDLNTIPYHLCTKLYYIGN